MNSIRDSKALSIVTQVDMGNQLKKILEINAILVKENTKLIKENHILVQKNTTFFEENNILQFNVDNIDGRNSQLSIENEEVIEIVENMRDICQSVRENTESLEIIELTNQLLTILVGIF